MRLLIRNIGTAGPHLTRYSDLGSALVGVGEFLRDRLVQWAQFQIWVRGKGNVAYGSLGP